MAFKLTKAQIKQRDELVEKLKERREALEQALRDANEKIEAINETLASFVTEYNELIEETEEYVAGVIEPWREDFEKKSDRWKESEAGGEVTRLIDQWEAVDLDTWIDNEYVIDGFSTDLQELDEKLADLHVGKDTI